MNDKTPSFHNHFEFVKHIMASEDYPHFTESQRQEILQRRIKKFYCTQEVIRVDEEHFKPRIEPIYLEGIQTSDDTLLVFGIDFLKKKQLKQMFSGFETQYYFIDESNCMIYFQNASDARMAIKHLVKEDSPTKLKIQQDQNSFQNQHSIKLTPKAWIELKPYKYTHHINKFNKQQYTRRLHVRFATTQEKQFGINEQSFLDYIYKSCEKIWESGMLKQNMKMRVLLERKMQRIKKAKQYRRTRGIDEMKESYGGRYELGHNPNEVGCNSMQWQNNKFKEQQYFQCNQKPINPNSSKSRLRQKLNDDIGLQIKSRSDTSEYQQMVWQLQELRLISNSLNQSFFLNSQTNSNNNHYSNNNNNMDTSFNLQRQNVGNKSNSNSIDISYKVVQPAQMKLNLCSDKTFNYKEYLNETIEDEERTKKIQYVDLTDL